MNEAWILQTSEIRRPFSRATWVPLRASLNDEKCNVKEVGYIGDIFACGSVAFPSKHRELAERLSWSEIGIGHTVAPYAYSDGHYSPIDEYQYNDKESIGINLVFEHPQPVVGGRQWILNPDLVVALRLIKEGSNWVRPEEDFVVVARETVDSDSSHRLIEIKREFLMDYLAARGLSLRLSYYRQRVENVADLKDSPYAGLNEFQEQREGGRYELRIKELNAVFGGSWASFRMWRTDVDEEEDAPVMGPETNDNTAAESARGHRSGYPGVRVEGEFWRDEWIEHQGKSTRVRGDEDQNLPHFIVDTDGSRKFSAELNNEDIGRWLWFRPSVVSELLSHRGFSLKWYTAETGAIKSTSGYSTHFGINSSELITVYAYDIAKLPAWEQLLWAATNVAPEGKVSAELLASQVKAQPADTYAVEEMLFECMRLLEGDFRKTFGVSLFSHEIDDAASMQQISRFSSKDQASLLRLAKELVRIFSDRLDVRSLRKLSNHPDKDKLGSNKLLQNILAQKAGEERAREVFAAIVGAYDMRLGDAHPTSSKIGEALKLAGIDVAASYLRQGEQLIHNFGHAVWCTGSLLFGDHEKNEG
ncbi:hypothetical protein AT959_03060 [Dechloromonas denitrificans]|uniref:Uncharacterized protein n=1 Tax=Dechloromonas denitrificans TaxID=281362 RepID=A0A133XM85_9RHOO|nr:hypothetical protein [Dechloromonas denitrificans]KXB32055.1 hypothetical protein AT959_03060 [Dechloromonas denitrificans]